MIQSPETKQIAGNWRYHIYHALGGPDRKSSLVVEGFNGLFNRFQQEQDLIDIVPQIKETIPDAVKVVTGLSEYLKEHGREERFQKAVTNQVMEWLPENSPIKGNRPEVQRLVSGVVKSISEGDLVKVRDEVRKTPREKVSEKINKNLFGKFAPFLSPVTNEGILFPLPEKDSRFIDKSVARAMFSSIEEDKKWIKVTSGICTVIPLFFAALTTALAVGNGKITLAGGLAASVINPAEFICLKVVIDGVGKAMRGEVPDEVVKDKFASLLLVGAIASFFAMAGVAYEIDWSSTLEGLRYLSVNKQYEIPLTGLITFLPDFAAPIFLKLLTEGRGRGN